MRRRRSVAPRSARLDAGVAGWQGAELVAALDLEGVSVSSGAACSAGTVEPSPVLAAMLGDGDAASGIRASLGEDTTDDDVARAIEAFRRSCSRRRRAEPARLVRARSARGVRSGRGLSSGSRGGGGGRGSLPAAAPPPATVIGSQNALIFVVGPS